MWGATLLSDPAYKVLAISIHAPRVGSDRGWKMRRQWTQLFQSTLPVWGATPRNRTEPAAHRHFNPRSPCGERLVSSGTPLLWHRISIHAPRVGSDDISLRDSEFEVEFQSTLPVWGATIPRSSSSSSALFQSTLPVWGATCRLTSKKRNRRHFNPRSPCGERRRRSGRVCR